VHGDHEQSQMLFDSLSQAGLPVHIPTENEEITL
jgi:hypothetical protein